VRLSVVVPVCCGADQAEVTRRAEAVGRPDLLRGGVCGGPDAVLDKLAELADAGVDTVYFHLYEVEDVDHVRLLGREVLPRA